MMRWQRHQWSQNTKRRKTIRSDVGKKAEKPSKKAAILNGFSPSSSSLSSSLMSGSGISAIFSSAFYLGKRFLVLHRVPSEVDAHCFDWLSYTTHWCVHTIRRFEHYTTEFLERGKKREKRGKHGKEHGNRTKNSSNWWLKYRIEGWREICTLYGMSHIELRVSKSLKLLLRNNSRVVE